MIWNETIECMDREEMRKLQSLRLKRVVEHAYHNSPFYRKKMQEMGIAPDDIQTIDDITKLPFTVKQDLRDNYPFGLMAVPMSEIVRLHASSGTTGKPIVVGYTRKDLGIWGRGGGSLPDRLWFDKERFRASILWLRNVYRRLGCPCRSGEYRWYGDPDE